MSDEPTLRELFGLPPRLAEISEVNAKARSDITEMMQSPDFVILSADFPEHLKKQLSDVMLGFDKIDIAILQEAWENNHE